ncbi:ankyrin repeat and MYND domain-containing protein 1 isoform X2 [Alosa sapidissima]|uniref:ankyrin repeat and MYND domain-containing protein 1 isoform X2 n=1 Tax=Alosa sapidissima TaxID=34773 RepID=UPI001C08A524|nr:ankyrin repeat and MYND domain-containing protein 1 isoform X2 [Alosa sapidissima]
MSSSVSHLDVPFPIGYIYSTEPDSGRNGLGVQEWPDGSKYEGEFVNDLKHGVGVYSWPNGEIYEGSFYKDYRHGKGTYTWPDGSKFSGKFYLNRKEGYGVQLSQDGSFFKGLYHADERFGPGVFTYADGRQDVGLWHRCRLFSLCTWLKDAFSLRSLPDFQSQQSRVQTGITLQGDPQNLRPELPKSTICKDPLVFSPEEMLKDERFILPPDTLRYANDPDHLPLPPRIRKHLDELFFSSSNPDTPVHTHTQVYTHTYGNTSCLPLQERMQEHINRHRCEVEALDWDVGAVLSMRREAFGPKGPLELGSERLIKEAARGDAQTVYHILRDGRIHPDVGDAQGHTPLLAATVNCHNEVINMLLDSGANVNKLNTEGMSALAICHVLYYPTSSLHTTVAELRLDRDSLVSVPKSPQADNQEDEASKNLTSPVPQKTESPDQSHSANEETAAPGHTQADPGEAPPLSSPVMEEVSEGEEPMNKSIKAQSEYSENEGLGNGQWEEPKQEASDIKGLQRAETKQETSDIEGPQGEESKQETSGIEGLQREEPKQETSDIEGLQRVETKQETSDIEGPQGEESIVKGSDREKLVNEASERVGPISEASEREGLINEESETGEPQIEKPIMIGLAEEPAESNRGTAGRDMTFDPESAEQRVASDSVVSLASFQIAVSKEALDQAAEALCHSGLLPAEGTQETVHKIALAKTQRSERWATLRLLLSRGADPNASLVPMPVLFLAIKAAHTHAVQLLLEAGARTDICLPSELNGLYPLHVAAGLPGDEGPRITELLLHAVADPDVQAQDTHVLFELDKNTPDPQGGSGNKPGNVSGAPPQGPGTGSPDRGRTPLHIACQRDQDHKNARDAVCVLLSHKASTSLLWSGHSPLSLAIASGNHLAVDVLLAWGADPNLPLSCRVGSALCANANIAYDCGTHSCNRILLLEKLIKAGADILMPILIGEGRRCVIGTAVDYAYCSFNQDWRIAHTPYHALNPRERETLNTRRQLLSIMGELLRTAATRNQQAALEMQTLGSSDRCLSTIMHTGAQASEENTSTGTISTDGKEEKRSVRKQDFKYCYQCGRSVGVVLLACSRCHEVFYCSKTCKMKAWNDRHKEECVRVQGQDHSEPSDTLESDPQRENTGNIKKASVKTPEQPSLITQMQAHFKKKMIVEKLNKKRKALSQKWAEKRLASGNQSKGWSAGAKGQSGLPKHPPKTPTYDPTENYSYI